MRLSAAALAMLVSALSCACVSPVEPTALTEEVCSVQSLACFHFAATLTVGARTAELSGWSQDLPTPGYRNRWHYILTAPAAGFLASYQAPTRGWNGGAAVIWPSGRGGMYMETLTRPGGSAYWRLEMRPTDPEVAEAFAALAGAQEYTAQTFVARPLSGGGAEIEITEPAPGPALAYGGDR